MYRAAVMPRGDRLSLDESRAVTALGLVLHLTRYMPRQVATVYMCTVRPTSSPSTAVQTQSIAVASNLCHATPCKPFNDILARLRMNAEDEATWFAFPHRGLPLTSCTLLMGMQRASCARKYDRDVDDMICTRLKIEEKHIWPFDAGAHLTSKYVPTGSWDE
jgi:hypothetical protein